MSQRTSGYERQALDDYETPPWVTLALLPHLPRPLGVVLEPAAGRGKLARVLIEAGATVIERDIARGQDFLLCVELAGAAAIVTNPPYGNGLAARFIDHALDLMQPVLGLVAMLLRTDFDHAATRRDQFGRHPAFAKKVVLTRRIVWFEPATGAPSFNHAWFIWDWRHVGPPTLAYGP